jgi:hypothetical protein
VSTSSPAAISCETWVWRSPCSVQLIFRAIIAAANLWVSQIGCRVEPSHLANTSESSAARPKPSASRRSCWRARYARNSATSQGEIATLRRPCLVFGALITLPGNWRSTAWRAWRYVALDHFSTSRGQRVSKRAAQQLRRALLGNVLNVFLDLCWTRCDLPETRPRCGDRLQGTTHLVRSNVSELRHAGLCRLCGRLLREMLAQSPDRCFCPRAGS